MTRFHNFNIRDENKSAIEQIRKLSNEMSIRYGLTRAQIILCALKQLRSVSDAIDSTEENENA